MSGRHREKTALLSLKDFPSWYKDYMGLYTTGAKVALLVFQLQDPTCFFAILKKLKREAYDIDACNKNDTTSKITL